MILISEPQFGAFSYENGIQTFDTANVSPAPLSPILDLPHRHCAHLTRLFSIDGKVYSNGASEVILGKAIKQLNLPRDEIVVMTKVSRSLYIRPFLFLPSPPPRRCTKARK